MPQALNFVSHYVELRRILERPELAAYITLVNVLWNRVEENADGILVAMLGTRELAATSLFREFQSEVINLRIRLDFVAIVGRLRLPPELASQLDDLLERVEKRSKERNALVHCFWHSSHKIKDGLIRVPRAADTRVGKPSPKHLIYKEKDFRDIADRMVMLASDLAKFSILCVQRRAPKQQQSPSPRKRPRTP